MKFNIIATEERDGKEIMLFDIQMEEGIEIVLSVGDKQVTLSNKVTKKLEDDHVRDV